MDTTYCLTQKIKNKKYIVATWKPDTKDTCFATARDCFQKHGLNSNMTGFKIDVLSYVQSEKMYSGFADNCITINDTVAEVDRWQDLKHIEFLKTHYPFYTIAEILLDHPDYAKYLTEEKPEDPFLTFAKNIMSDPDKKKFIMDL